MIRYCRGLNDNAMVVFCRDCAISTQGWRSSMEGQTFDKISGSPKPLSNNDVTSNLLTRNQLWFENLSTLTPIWAIVINSTVNLGIE